ncbi:MAG: phytanoyl-CoA dioxygenase family protein, partial [Deltaproteobacteria bacterium]|nr:phytanoyl-CoA dioxygenase family protein [Deltaproteobacteria bacterium]
GQPLDLSRTFTLDDPDDDLRAFLRTAGFLHVKRAFVPDEVAALGAELERVRAALEPGAGDCWWSTNGAGEQVVTRINYLDRGSDTLGETGLDPRIQRLGRLEHGDLRMCADRLDGPMAFVKNADVVQGLGDLQWHQDDGLGGHPIMCPLMQVGIQLDPANAANGQVRVLAGSHRYSNHPLSWDDEAGKPVVALETEPGDVTVHFGDVFHTTPPPTSPDAGRRVLYFKFAPPQTFQTIPPGGHYNDILFKPDAAGRVATRAATWEDDDTQAGFEERTFDENENEGEAS